MPLDVSETIEKVKNNDPDLKTLYLTNKKLSLKVFKKLAIALETNTVVETCTFSDNKLLDKGAKILEILFKKNKHIREVELINTGITSEGLKSLVNGIIQNKTLEILNIGGNIVSYYGDGSSALVDLITDNHTLKELSLGATFLTERGACDILKALENNYSLQNLDTRFNDDVTHETRRKIEALLQRNQELATTNNTKSKIGLSSTNSSLFSVSKEKESPHGDATARSLNHSSSPPPSKTTTL